LFRVYRDLIALRKGHLRLFVDGTLHWLITDDAQNLLAYERVLGDQRAIVAFNVSGSPRDISIAADGRYRLAFPMGAGVTVADGTLRAHIPPRSGMVWIRE
jgi:glycosidase